MTDFELLSMAKESRIFSYSPYSEISVGAALLCEGERVYVGANIENAAHSPTVCAERVAFFKAISEGERRFLKIAVVGGKSGSDTVPLFSPCGVCRQVMEEFAPPILK
jgi:cytidine deaminase